MQEDMHYYGTYALARAAGLKVDHARIIAYSAQYVDDSTAIDSEVHKDGGMFETVATAHTDAQSVRNSIATKIADNSKQRKVWIPFHFFPGGVGNTFSDKLKCVKDGELAQEMVNNHIRHSVAVKNENGLQLMGIMAHVYADTFSHYGFSGVSSRGNEVNSESFELYVENEEVKYYIENKFDDFLLKYAPSLVVRNFRSLLSKGASFATGALGHAAVGTYPDRPFLKWKFAYKRGNKNADLRNNRDTFLEGCEKIHSAFCKYATEAGQSIDPVDFSDIKGKISNILSLEADKEGRINAWRDAIGGSELFKKDANEALDYSPSAWEAQKDDFDKLSGSHKMLNTEVYKFHQAAAYHRNYTLKQLLPKHGIMVI